MTGTLLIHFVAGTLACLVVFLVFARLSGARSFSAPFGIIFIGIACAALAHFISPWATTAIIAVYLLINTGEFVRERRARNSGRSGKGL